MAADKPESYYQNCVEFMALTQLQEELRGNQNYDLRNEVSSRLTEVRERITRNLMGRGRRSPENGF